MGLAAASVANAQSGASLFSSEDRDRIAAYWSSPDRYTVAPPKDSRTKGLWHVRLTVEGSTWLWKYNRGRKETALLEGASGRGGECDEWVRARIARDRWEAWNVARESNLQSLHADLPVMDSTIPSSEPQDPGQMPGDLATSVGLPPKFAEAVVVMEHTIDFGGSQLSYRDHVRPSSPSYAFYRYDLGVMSGGTPVKKLPDDVLDRLFSSASINPSQARVMRSVSLLEGGFDSVNTYDTGFVSVGFIQFACLREGGGSLGRVMLREKTENSEAFNRDFHDFGLEVSTDGKLVALDFDAKNEIVGPAAAQKIILDKRYIAVFQRAGQLSDEFRSAQIAIAKADYWPEDDVLNVNVGGQILSGHVSDVIKSEAGLATLFDRKVNLGKIDLLTSTLEKYAADLKPTRIEDFAAIERQVIADMRYRHDYLADSTLSQPEAGINVKASRPANPTGSRSGSRGGRGSKKKSRI